MASAFQEYHVQLVNKRTQLPIDDDSGVVNVLTTLTPVEATIFSDDAGTSRSNPLTMTNGEIRFWLTSSVQSVDISGLTATGHPFFVVGLTPSQHRVEIDLEDKVGMKLVIPFNINASTSLFDTGFDLHSKHIVNDVQVRVTTVGGAGSSSVTANLLQVGTSAAVTELVGTCQISTTGFYQNVQQITAFPAGTGSVSMLVGAMLLGSATNTHWRKKGQRSSSTSGARIIYRDHSTTGIKGQGYIYINLDLIVI